MKHLCYANEVRRKTHNQTTTATTKKHAKSTLNKKQDTGSCPLGGPGVLNTKK
jgi:hypothetical protein